MEASNSVAPSQAANLTDAWTGVAREVAAIESALNRWLERNCGVGLTEYRAALLLYRSPGRELRINDLTEQLGLSQSSVTRMVERLERKDIAFRDVCPDDGRGIYAALTEEGLNMVDNSCAQFEDELRFLVSLVSENSPNFGPVLRVIHNENS